MVLGALGCERGKGYYLGRPLPGISHGNERIKRDDENEASTSVGRANVVSRAQQRAERQSECRAPSNFYE